MSGNNRVGRWGKGQLDGDNSFPFDMLPIWLPAGRIRRNIIVDTQPMVDLLAQPRTAQECGTVLMAFNEQLAERIRKVLARRKGIAEKKMFGGIGFLLNGNMCVGVWKESLIVRLD